MKLSEALLKLDEKALMIGGNKSFSAPNNHILVLAGGAGSGKGFVLTSIINFEGKKFDVDDLKQKIADIGKSHTENGKIFAEKFKEYAGWDISKFNIENPEHVKTMHTFVDKMGYAKNLQKMFFKSSGSSSVKPNVIFDVTLKTSKKLEDISKLAELGGYPKENIHIVWVLNKLRIAIEQNQSRQRKVPTDILIDSHNGASQTLKKIVTDSTQYRKLADGDIFIVFNQKGVDVTFKKDDKGNETNTIKDFVMIKLKDRGKAPIDLNTIRKDLWDKLKEYIPQKDVW